MFVRDGVRFTSKCVISFNVADLFLCFLFILGNGSLIDLTRDKQNSTTDGGFPCVDVPDKHDVDMLAIIMCLACCV